MRMWLTALLAITNIAQASPPPWVWGADNKALDLQQGLALPQSATPAGNPPTGDNYLYFKSDNHLYMKDHSGTETQVDGGGGGGTGDVVGPASSTADALAVFSGTTGKLLKNSSATISGSTITATLAGNASTATLAATATALAANPTDCASDTWATTIAASGNLTCSTITDAGLAVSYLKADGSRGLSADWNAGAHNITATTFIGALTGAASSNVLKAGDTMTGTLINSFAGTASNSGVLISGAPFTGGSATTTKPQLNVETAGAITTNWTTTGTMVGINAPSGFTGLLEDAQVNGVRKFSMDGGSTSKFSVSSVSETVALTNDGSTICLDNTTHSNSCFLRFRPNTGYTSAGVGTNTNSWGFALNVASTDTAPGTNLVPNGTGATQAFACHNSNTTAGNYCGVIGTTAGSDKLTAGFLFFADVHTASSETGHVELWHNIASVKTKIMTWLNKGLIVHSGTAPAAGTCATSPGIPVGDSNVFKITSGTGGVSGTCAVTLPTAPPGGGHCTCRDDTSPATTIVDAGISSTTITLTTYSRTTGLAANFTASDVFSCQCQYY